MERVTRSLPVSGALAFLLVASGAAFPAEKRFIIVQPGYPSTTVEAAGFVSELARAITAGGGPAGLEGIYYNQAGEALEAIRDDHPILGIVSLGFFLAHRKDLQLEVVCRSEPLERFYLVARKTEPVSPGELAGKEVAGTPFEEREFVERLLFGPGASGEKWESGKMVPVKVSAGEVVSDVSLWTVKKTTGFSRGVRYAAGGRVRAVLLNERERKSMEKLTAGKELQVFYQTEKLPTALVVLFGKADDVARKAASAMEKLNEKPAGKVVLEAMGIPGFVPVDARRFARLQARYVKENKGGEPREQ